MAALDHRIDELYRQPLADFVAARTELAKGLSGEDAKRVKALKKPTVVPWAVNQLYWSSRATYETLIKRGGALRSAQLSSLKGRRADVRAAADAHKEALLASVKQAQRISSEQGANPDVDLLIRTLEALSLAAGPTPEPVGRLTTPLQPAGFEALTGATIKASGRPYEAISTPASGSSSTESPKELAAQRAADRRHAQEEARAERERASTIRKAELDVAKARAREAEARQEWERAQSDLETARRKLVDVQNS